MSAAGRIRGRVPADALDDARAAIALLTIAPVGRRAVPDAARARAGAWFPLVGAAVGLVAGTAFAIAEPQLGGLYAALLALLASAIAAGGLHHDGLADSADGLGARGDRERRLAAMRDPGVGAHGALALIAFVALAAAALARLPPDQAAGALVCGHALGRWAAVAQLALLAPARADGLGAAWSAGPAALALASAGALAIAIVAAGTVAGLSAAAAALVAGAAVALLARRLVGGRSGDTLGAAVLVVELAVYSLLAAYWLT